MLRVWLRGHALAAIAATVVADAIWLTAPDPSQATRIAVLAALIAVLGLPHGAVDHIQGRTLLAARWGHAWPVLFGAGYTVVAAAIVAAWIAWPPGLLIAFLVLAIGHFGAEDTAAGRLVDSGDGGGGLRLGEDALRGALPVLLPIAFHPAVTAAHFAALLPHTDVEAVRAVLAAMAPLGSGYLAALAGLALAALWRTRIPMALELAVLAATFWVLPPLMAFAVYFCVWHAPRHTLGVIAAAGHRTLTDGLAWFGRQALPLTLVTIALAGGAWLVLRDGTTAATATRQVVFIGLAALTVPHVGLAAWSRLAARRREAVSQGLSRTDRRV